jgi:hypothetical protein
MTQRETEVFDPPRA